ncbi:hypothetical protein C8R45DRAFT_1096005 [Mycena sanguinolenta]|nr:hypothetical protein C8R45DRAFT_1096005 [Mycena sanguinolenta]
MDTTFLDDSDSALSLDASSDDPDFDPEAPEPEIELDEDVPTGPAIQLQQTEGLRARMQGNIQDKVKSVLFAMDREQINLPIFLDALSWGDSGCITDPKILLQKGLLAYRGLGRLTGL